MLLARVHELEKQLQGLRDEGQKQEELAAERERGTAKGRTYEESVADAVDRSPVCTATPPRRWVTSAARAASEATSWSDLEGCSGRRSGPDRVRGQGQQLTNPNFRTSSMEQRS